MTKTTVIHQIDYTSERHTGHWSCHDCEARGESRDALVLAAKHTRTTGHKTQAATTSKVIYHPIDWIAPVKPEVKERERSDDEKKLLAAVMAHPRMRHFEYESLIGFTGKRLERARDALIDAGLIAVEKQRTGGGPRKVLVATQSAESAVRAA